MKSMRRIVLLGAAAALLSGGAWAQAAATSAGASGEVTKLDKAGSRITLKHAGVKNLDMPPMTMVFSVRDARLFDGVAVGDRVRFGAERIDGQYTVTALAKAPS